MGDRGVDRRGFLAAGAALAGGASGLARANPLLVAEAAVRPKPPLGSGGTPTALARLAELARAHGRGYPVLFVDLAALDRNLSTVGGFASAQGWDMRPALKSFRSPELISYVLRRLPKPRGLVFNLSEVDGIIAAAPGGTDLMTGYPPTVGELRGFLRSRPPSGQRKHTLRILIDSVPLMQALADAAKTARRRRPIEVAIELDVGMGRGGINDRAELASCVEILRANRERLRLGAVLGYDGHATLDGDPNYRRAVATQARAAYSLHLANLADLGDDLYDAKTLIRNGPGSSNYRNWVGGPITEISPGSALLYARYLDGGYDTEGLVYGLTAAGAVRRVTSDHPSVPVTGTTPPGANEEEVIVQAISPPDELVHPPGAREDELSGGGDALVVPKGSVGLGDYVLYRPLQLEVPIVNFEAMVAVRNGRPRRVWSVPPRPGNQVGIS